jgi:hypothetical protein
VSFHGTRCPLHSRSTSIKNICVSTYLNIENIHNTKSNTFTFNLMVLSCVIQLTLYFLTAHIVEDRRMKNPLNNSSPISTQCYARVFISVKGDQRSRFSRSSNNIVTGSGGSVGSADGVGFADNEGTSPFNSPTTVTCSIPLGDTNRTYSVFISCLSVRPSVCLTVCLAVFLAC